MGSHKGPGGPGLGAPGLALGGDLLDPRTHVDWSWNLWTYSISGGRGQGSRLPSPGTSWVLLDTLLNVTEPQYSHLEKGDARIPVITVIATSIY